VENKQDCNLKLQFSQGDSAKSDVASMRELDHISLRSDYSIPSHSNSARTYSAGVRWSLARRDSDLHAAADSVPASSSSQCDSGIKGFAHFGMLIRVVIKAMFWDTPQ
jgi:hypothetical protein